MASAIALHKITAACYKSVCADIDAQPTVNNTVCEKPCVQFCGVNALPTAVLTRCINVVQCRCSTPETMLYPTSREHILTLRLIMSYIYIYIYIYMERPFLMFLDHTQRRRRADCGRSPAEILGSNPTGGMDICLL